MTATALLVIDLQRGAFDGVRCPPVDSADALIAAACNLVDAARAGGVPVVWVQHGEGAGAPFEEGSPHWALHEALEPAPGEPCIAKRESSAFAGTDLEARLRELGITRLVLCGLQSEFCVSNTARSALALGYEVRLASGAHGTWPEGGQSAAQIRARVESELIAAGADVADLATLNAELRAGSVA